MLRVQDTGIGMNQLTIRRVFNPFEKAAPHISAEGFGLGLSIVKGIVNLLGGKISVSSTEGIGSCFEVSIPMSETNLNEEIPSPVRTFSGILPKRVIAIDDDQLQLAVMKEMLERNGGGLHHMLYSKRCGQGYAGEKIMICCFLTFR